MKSGILLSTLVSGVVGAAAPYAQCGGDGWTGETTCTDGYVCTKSNQWYSQCLVGTNSAAATTTLKTSSTSKTSTTSSTKTTVAASAVTSKASSGTSGKLKWLGADESCAEFGEGNYPGVDGTHYTFPDETAMGVS